MTSLIYFECKKIFGNFKWLILVGILIVKVIFTYNSISVKADYSIKIYKDYISTLSQMSKTQAEEYILSEYDRINGIIGEYITKEDQYSSGEITLDEYKAYMNTYYEANSKKNAFDAVYKRYEQFSAIAEKNRVYFYDLEWKAFGEALGLDFFALFTLFIFCVPVFCREHSSDTHMLNMVTKNGRQKLHIAKLIVIIMFALLSGVVIYSLDFAVYGFKYGFANGQMPIQAVTGYTRFADDVSIRRLFITMAGAKILWGICASLAITVVCLITKSSVISIIISAFFILAPVTVASAEKGLVAKFNIGAGLQGLTENVAKKPPLYNLAIWIVINIIVMTIMYRKRKCKESV